MNLVTSEMIIKGIMPTSEEMLCCSTHGLMQDYIELNKMVEDEFVQHGRSMQYCNLLYLLKLYAKHIKSRL